MYCTQKLCNQCYIQKRLGITPLIGHKDIGPMTFPPQSQKAYLISLSHIAKEVQRILGFIVGRTCS